MLLHWPQRGGTVSRRKLQDRVDLFNQGLWVEMVNIGQEAARQAKDIQVRKNRRDRCRPDNRATRAEKLAMAGELSAARKALDNAAVAPGNMRTLRALTNPERRTQSLDLLSHVI